MRGDSRIDLYAKSLALAGLGLLGAAGAVIDYWPARVRLPHVATAFQRPVSPRVETIIDLRGVQSAPSVTLAEFSPRVLPRRVLRAGLARPLPVSSAMTSAAAAPHELAMPDAQLPLEVFSAQALPESRRPVAELEAAEAAPEATAAGELESLQPIPAPAPSVDAVGGGLLAGVLKKTTSSVGSSLSTVSSSIGKASTSLVGAMKFVGDAVKKAF